MKRPLVLVGIAALLLSVCSAHGSPVSGKRHDRRLLNIGETFRFRESFRANERACIIVVGDHDPVMNLKIEVRDAAGKIVASDLRGGDILSATWYPPRTQEYFISISGDGDIENVLEIILK